MTTENAAPAPVHASMSSRGPEPDAAPEAPTVRLRPALIEGETSTIAPPARIRQARTYSFADVTRYVNKALKGQMTPPERANFFKNAASAWYQLAPAMEPHQRLHFLRKLTKAFRNFRKRMPNWNPKIDETGEIIVPVTKDDLLAAMILQERAIEKYHATKGETTPEERKEISAQSWRDYVAWSGALTAESETIEVDVASDVGEQKIWNVTYPDGAKTTMTLDGKAPIQRVRGLAARNWKLMARIDTREDGAYLKFSEIKVETVQAKLIEFEGDDDKVLEDLMLIQEEIDAVRFWSEETA